MRRFLCAAILVVASGAVHAAVWYVDKGNVSGTEDGTSWETAFSTVQPAIDAAADDGGGSVWVAAGVYDEVRDAEDGAIICRANVHLCGGFAGDEKSLAKRDLDAHESILDGSVARGGEPAYHVVRVFEAQGVQVEGFTIRGGRGYGGWLDFEDSGGGFCVWGRSEVLVRRCRFTDNEADRGGAMACPQVYCRALLRIESCLFDGNRGGNGGALYMLGAATIDQCSFLNNHAQRLGGAAYLEQDDGVCFTGCVFAYNRCDGEGGAVYNDYASPYWYDSSSSYRLPIESIPGYPQYVNCLFHHNTAARGGAIANSPSIVFALVYEKRDAPVPMLRNCTLAFNTATEAGGAILNEATVTHVTYTTTLYPYSTSSSSNKVFHQPKGSRVLKWGDTEYVGLHARNCILWGNGPDQIHAGLASNHYVCFTVDSSNIEGGYEGIGNLDEDPGFLDPENGDFRLASDSPCVDTGTDNGAPATDLLGMPRPMGTEYDMGAYEYVGPDTDDDGIPDTVEGDADPDEDSIPNLLDPDSDGDGIPDAIEGVQDSDGDGAFNFLDTDSDDNGIPDAEEGAGDPDYDGFPNYTDPDNDNDTRTDAWEGVSDGDDDGLPDYLDPDSDGDGTPDSEERLVVFVDKGNAPGVYDGKAWATAFTTIQDAIDTALSNGGNAEVRIAAGLYDEDRSVYDGAIQMVDGVDLLGGYAPAGVAPRVRDWRLYETQLDASTSRYGNPGLAVVLAANATLEGFVIREFVGSREGAVYSEGVSPHISHCVFADNTADRGAAIYVEYGHPVVSDCTFADGVADVGGAAYLFATTCDFIRCVFLENSLREDTDYGGAVFVSGSTLNLDNCLFVAGVRSFNGSAVYAQRSFLTITHCTFREEGGASAVTINESDAQVRNSILSAANAIEIAENSSAYVVRCCVPGGHDGAGNIDADPLFADAPGGDFHPAEASPCIDTARIASSLSETDLDGQPRYQGAWPDIGAFEFPSGVSAPFCSGDSDHDNQVSLSELLRVVQFFNDAGYQCAAALDATEDGYLPGPGAAKACAPHTSDYAPQDWRVDLSELLRLIQFFNSPAHAYHYQDGTEDDFAPGPGKMGQ